MISDWSRACVLAIELDSPASAATIRRVLMDDLKDMTSNTLSLVLILVMILPIES